MSKPLSNSTFKHHLSPPALNVHSVGGGLLLFDMNSYSSFVGRPGYDVLSSSTCFVCLSFSAFHNVSPNNIERTTNYRRRRGITPLLTLPNTGLGDIPRRDWINHRSLTASQVSSGEFGCSQGYGNQHIHDSLNLKPGGCLKRQINVLLIRQTSCSLARACRSKVAHAAGFYIALRRCRTVVSPHKA